MPTKSSSHGWCQGLLPTWAVTESTWTTIQWLWMPVQLDMVK
jgi:hypothetical protein